MTKPLSPIVAMNANASVTPPNWASTPQAEVTSRRTTLSGPAGHHRVARAARRSTAPRTAVTADSVMLRTNASTM